MNDTKKPNSAVKEKASMFISYSHANREQCVRIAEAIDQTGLFEIWFDNSHMFLGQILTYSDDKTYEKRDEAIEALLKYALKELV